MNKFCNGSSAALGGFSAAATDELDQIEGGQTSMGPYKPFVDGTADSWWRLVGWLRDQSAALRA